MRAAVVYESLMGNTRDRAEAIIAGLREARPDVEVSSGRTLPPPDVDPLIVGGPTHFFGIPRARTQRMWVKGQASAAQKGRSGPALEPDASQPGVREWLDQMPTANQLRYAATFDTRLDRAFSGGAAPKIGRRLRRKGYRLISAPQAFIVEGMTGPLRAGEVQRARNWGRILCLRPRPCPPPVGPRRRPGHMTDWGNCAEHPKSVPATSRPDST
jgi:hypothetical protein